MSPTRARERTSESFAEPCRIWNATAAASVCPSMSVRSAAAKVRSSIDVAARSALGVSRSEMSLQKSPFSTLSVRSDHLARWSPIVIAASTVSVGTTPLARPSTIAAALTIGSALPSGSAGGRWHARAPRTAQPSGNSERRIEPPGTGKWDLPKTGTARAVYAGARNDLLLHTRVTRERHANEERAPRGGLEVLAPRGVDAHRPYAAHVREILQCDERRE